MGQLSTIREEFDELRDAEQDAFDNLPESLRAGERGVQMEGNIDALDEVAVWLEQIDDSLQEIIGG